MAESPQERLLHTAHTLFYQRGLNAVGINEVISEASVARMTLYNNFRSKEELALAAFRAESLSRQEMITEAQRHRQSAAEKVAALFDVARELGGKEGFRGCAFLNLALETADRESPLHELALEHKNWIQQQIHSWLLAESLPGADRLARQILILWDGAVTHCYLRQSVTPLDEAQDATETLIAASRI